ncbi:hypothetical protein EHI8A_240580 [Entamoeba histolytica HM-1:IMSS-B]|uniref:Hus1 family protein n=4 Tax=Entamoeba histolytica TaxID=5759 RepID=C4LZ11_ENTH1|nr:hypothetical protein EHI_118290 [Entamoeba histolytica HM-1:IMSS]EAL50694.1 hypothetical protein EHI_118290 [Entamoeba histolytica HM-1:IMSS]EMH73322.1 hypothetical protein EHI8A_240580 [Entamoeba histolytica HM-1:IMSS-B]ENY62069.1 Hus1 family protein, putative [Entamoeba histolytica HM-1:IMSS-A]GAT94080.1 hypothetical protein CL6EHI_118290 [Entamoeba histolytica]|eukprot:XP_656080.1 hypothetical protein EHI_118290 [Entamoeba histolytica HM-1:IMSS]
MRFKAEIQKIEAFLNVVRFFAAVGKQGVFAIGKEDFFVVYKDSLSQLYSIFMSKLSPLFSAFEYDGTEDHVYLEFSTDDLLRVMLNIKESEVCQISLTRSATKRVPCLNFKTNTDGMEVTQELIVTINKQGADLYHQPIEMNAQMDVSGQLHSMKQMKQALDKMAELSEEVVFSASHEGDIRLVCSSKQSKMEVVFSEQDHQPNFIFSCACQSGQFKKFFILEKLEPELCEYYYEKDMFFILKATTNIGEILIYIPVIQP